MAHFSKEHTDDVIHMSVTKALTHRLPWLLIGLLGGIFSAKIIENFEKTLEQNLILAAFIPLVVYMADAVGTQMEAFIIRDLAMHPRMKFSKYLIKQLLTVSTMGILLSGSLFIISIFLYNSTSMALVLSLSLFVAILSSVVTGLFIPYFFERTRLDPANASGPIATIIQDIISVTIYFIIASKLL